MKKILFVGYNLQTGGIQTALINTLKVLNANNNYLLDLFIFSGGCLETEVPKDIQVIKGNYLLNLLATPFSEVRKKGNIRDTILRLLIVFAAKIAGTERLLTLLFLFHKMEMEYDIAISYFNDVPNNTLNQGCNKFALDKIKAKKKIAWIHNDPILAGFNKEHCRKIYKKFDAIINVSRSCKEKFDVFLPEYKEKSFTVYNFFPVCETIRKADECDPFVNKDKILLVTVARIDNRQKRIDKILKVCEMLKTNGINNFKWYVIGGGPDLPANKDIAVTLGINDLIVFLGNKINPYPYIKNADVFVLTSDYEGYPMVIGEALLLKTAVVTTNYAAAHEQVKHCINGIITGMSEHEIFNELKNLLMDTSRISFFKANLDKDVFTNDLALSQINKVLNI